MTRDSEEDVRTDPIVSVDAIASLTIEVRRVVEGFLGGKHAALHRGASVEFAQHHPYFQGDDLRHLDWKAMARTDRLYIKAREREVVLNCLLLLDCSASMNYTGSRARMSKFAYARVLLGAMGHLLLKQGDAVGLLGFAETPCRFLPPHQRPDHLSILLKQFATLAPAKDGTTDYREAISMAAGHLRQRSMIAVASDLWGLDEEAQIALASLSARGHDVIVFHVLSPDEVDFPFSDSTLFRGMESDPSVLADPALVREDYRQSVQREIAHLDVFSGRSGIDLLHAQTVDPPERVLGDLVERRAGKRMFG